MSDINYPQRWLSEHRATTNNVGWIRPTTHEMLKCQKGLDFDPIDVETVYMIIPDIVDCEDIIPMNIRFLPRTATEFEYDLTISDTTLCVLNQETSNFEFQGKPGEVTFTVTMKTGGASFNKTVQVKKNANAVIIKEGNTFVQHVERDATITLIPEDTTEKVLNVSVFNNKEVVITKTEESNKFKIKSDVIGVYDLKVETDLKTYKLSIYIVETEDMIVESLNVDVKPSYKFNETIFIQPSFIPPTATLKDYTVLVNDSTIAKWFSGKNAIITNEKNGATKVTIQMINGPAKFEFELKVQDTSIVIPPEDITLIIPTKLDIEEEKELIVQLTPANATVDDLQITSTEQASIRFANGKWYIKGEKVGDATITVTSAENNISKTYTVQVNPLLVSSFTFSAVPGSLVVGEEHEVTIIANPSNASDKTFTLVGSENVEITTVVENSKFKYKALTDTPATGFLKAIANDEGKKESQKNFAIEAAPILVDYIEWEPPAEVHHSTVFNLQDLVLVEPADATDKTWTATPVSGVVAVEENSLVYFTGAGSAKLKIKANDAGGEEIIVDLNVTSKQMVLDAQFKPFGELLNDNVPVTLGMTVYPEDAFSDFKYYIVEKLNENDITVNLDKVSCGARPGAVKAIARDEYTQMEWPITIIAFDKDSYVEKADVYFPSLVVFRKETPLYIITEPEFGRRTQLEAYFDGDAYNYDAVTNTIKVNEISENPKMTSIWSQDGLINFSGLISSDYDYFIKQPDSFELTIESDNIYINNEIDVSFKFFKDGVELTGQDVNTFIAAELYIDGVRQFRQDGFDVSFTNMSSPEDRSFYRASVYISANTFAETVGKEYKLAFIHVDSEQIIEFPIEFEEKPSLAPTEVKFNFGQKYINLSEANRIFPTTISLNNGYVYNSEDESKITFECDHGTMVKVNYPYGFLYEYHSDDYEGDHNITVKFKISETVELVSHEVLKAFNVIKISEIKFNSIMNGYNVLYEGNTYDFTPTVIPANATNANNLALEMDTKYYEHVSGYNYKVKILPELEDYVNVNTIIKINDPYFIDGYKRSGFLIRKKINKIRNTKLNFDNIALDEDIKIGLADWIVNDSYSNTFTRVNYEAIENVTFSGSSDAPTMRATAIGPYSFYVYPLTDQDNKILISGNVIDKSETLSIIKNWYTYSTLDYSANSDFENGILRVNMNLQHPFNGPTFIAIPQFNNHKITMVSSDPTIVEISADNIIMPKKEGNVSITVTTSDSSNSEFISKTEQFDFIVKAQYETYDTVWIEGHPVNIYSDTPYLCNINSTPDGATSNDIEFKNFKNCYVNSSSYNNWLPELKASYNGVGKDNEYYYEIWSKHTGTKISHMGGFVKPNMFDSIKTSGLLMSGIDDAVTILYGAPYGAPELITNITSNNELLNLISYEQSSSALHYSIPRSEKGKSIVLTVTTINTLTNTEKEYTVNTYVGT